MKDLMVDLETLSAKDNAAIIAIGAVEFDITTGKTGETFYTNVDWKSNKKAGRHIDVNTVQWWMKQSDVARFALFEDPTVSFATAIVQFATFFKGVGAKHIWSHASFDERILRSACNEISLEVPWHYRGIRDIRTLMGILKEGQATTVSREGTHHNALDDALFQVKYCHEAWKMIHGKV